MKLCSVKQYLCGMVKRKRWTKQGESNPDIERTREKKKWQITFRRYVLEKNPSPAYAPFFGLDIENLRRWLELQFDEDISWENFGERWHFGHVVPVSYFDMTNEQECKTCWNFVNIRVEKLLPPPNRTAPLNLESAKTFFETLYNSSGYEPCRWMLQKIEAIKKAEQVNTKALGTFLIEKKEYLRLTSAYSNMEFEMLNTGRDIEDIEKEIALLKKLAN